MTEHVYLSADKTKIVPEYALGKKWQVPRKVAVEMGLLESVEKPVQARRTEQKRRSKPKTKDE